MFKRTTEKRSAKHTSYFKLTECFKKSGCPICRRNHEAAYNYLENLMYENVNDSFIRNKLKQSFGFCRNHANILLEIGDSLGSAIIYKEMLEYFEKVLNEHNYSRFINRGTCPVCDLVSEQSLSDIKLLIDFVDELDFQKAFQSSDGLCAQHLISLLQNCKSKTQSDFFLSFHKEKIKALEKLLSDLIRKGDYRFRNEKISMEEAASWKKALTFINEFN